MQTKVKDLSISDWIFVASFAFIFFLGVDPFVTHLDVMPFFKHIPLLIFLLAYVFYFITEKLNHVDFVRPKFIFNVGLIFFSFFVLFGSLIARFVYAIDNTFLNMGLLPVSSILISVVVLFSRRSIFVFKMVILVWFFIVIVSFINQIRMFKVDSVIHNHEHLVIPFVILLYFLFSSIYSRMGIFFAFLLLCIAAHKNTSYILFFISILYVSASYVYSNMLGARDHFLKVFYSFSLLLLALAAAGLLLIGYLYKSYLFPSGNPTYRLQTYEAAFNRFLDSPIFGNFFTAPATEVFTGFQVAANTQTLPTHSDPLDILANGGLIGFLLFISIYIFLLLDIKKYKVFSVFDTRLDRAILHFLVFTIFSGLFVCSFNPILNTPNSAFSYWIALGIMYGYISCAKLKTFLNVSSEV